MKLNSPLTFIKCFIGKKSRTTEDVYLSDFFKWKWTSKMDLYIILWWWILILLILKWPLNSGKKYLSQFQVNDTCTLKYLSASKSSWHIKLLNSLSLYPVPKKLTLLCSQSILRICVNSEWASMYFFFSNFVVLIFGGRVFLFCPGWFWTSRLKSSFDLNLWIARI